MDKVARLLVDGSDVAPVIVADTYFRRLRGMLGRHPLPPALILIPTNSVHGMGMRDALDVAHLDSDGTVLSTTVLRPMRATRSVRGAKQVLEAPVGSFADWGLSCGSRIEVGGIA
ncbi:MAG: DUF192 domain-containing protein [Micrococcales bacterium]|nr:DUF192 domain-containing protein [Micrococcales bacterium]